MKQDVSLERSANRYTVSVHYFIKKEIAFRIIFCYSIKQNLKARIYLWNYLIHFPIDAADEACIF